MSSTRKLTTLALGAAASAGALAAVVTTTSASAGTPAGGTFTVIAHHHSESTIDLGRRGFSPGDVDLFTDVLGRGGDRIGWLTGTCRVVRVGRSTADQLCEFDLSLGGAQLTTTGQVRSTQNGPGTFTLPITGGTGRYRGASGQISVTATDGPSLPITISLD
jgi:hypothetical protein